MFLGTLQALRQAYAALHVPRERLEVDTRRDACRLLRRRLLLERTLRRGLACCLRRPRRLLLRALLGSGGLVRVRVRARVSSQWEGEVGVGL